MVNALGLHEKLEVHELLVFKNLCLTKSVAMSGLAQDEKLKSILTNDVNAGVKFVQDLQGILTEGSKGNE